MTLDTTQIRGPKDTLKASSGQVVLSVQDLWLEYKARRGVVKAVRGATFQVRRGESLAVIGESGSGKTTLGLGLVRLLPRTARTVKGHVRYFRVGHEVDVLALPPNELRQFRWKECAMVFQSALNALNPVLRVSDQFADTARAHGGSFWGGAAHKRAQELLKLVQLDPDRVLRAYPHELSGGMRQRVLIAMCLLLDPQIVILDEPTTALDILTQRAVIDVLKSLRDQLEFSLIFISHDLSLAAELADQVATMYAGAVVEIGDVYEIFEQPRHPYTEGLIHAVPTVTGELEQLFSIPGSPPDLIELLPGCKFAPRCPYAVERCRVEEPTPEEVGPGHLVACYNWNQVGTVEHG